MDNLSGVIGANLAALRRQRGLSLDKVAELSGVSKAMIGQIERAESNPTVATLWKIASGLKVSFSELITEQRPRVELIRECAISPMIDSGDGMTVYPFFPFEQDRRFEIFVIDLAAGARHSSEPHEPGSEEYLLLTKGSLELAIGGETHALQAGDAIRYQADRPHAYHNPGRETARFQNLIYYGPTARTAATNR
ncbi:MAG TPA: helix-turn-helix domain-containing protein [Selenomonadales bacterium]|nr:helix-turn-helix domain-containing protein [Selenomonadales bacterium]